MRRMTSRMNAMAGAIMPGTHKTSPSSYNGWDGSLAASSLGARELSTTLPAGGGLIGGALWAVSPVAGESWMGVSWAGC